MLQRGMKCIVAMAATVSLAGFATAQEYPAKIVRLVIPYPPGGSAEAQARIVAQALQAEWKQSVVVHVPFKGTGPALTALLGDQVHYFFADVAVLPMLKAGKLRALAVTGSQRFSLLPDAPTMIEAGVPGYTTTNWSALVAPAGTPPEIIARINAAVRSALRTPEVVQRYNAQGYEPAASSPQELEAHMIAEVEKYAKAVASAGVKVD